MINYSFDAELMLSDGKIRQVYCNARTCYAYQRSQKIYPFKKRKFFYQQPLTSSDRGFDCESICSSPEKAVDGDNCCAGSRMHPVCFIFSSYVYIHTLHLHLGFRF